MNRFANHWFSYSLIALWIMLCLLCSKYDLVSRFANKGAAIIGNEYYRYGTSLLLHSNFIHALFNGLALFFACRYLESQINPAKLLVFSVLIGIVTDLIFSAIFRNSVSVGGSPIAFSLIGLISAMQITKNDFTRFQLGTWYGNWTLAYVVLANLPFFSDNAASTLVIHGMALVFGFLLGCAGIVIGII